MRRPSGRERRLARNVLKRSPKERHALFGRETFIIRFMPYLPPVAERNGGTKGLYFRGKLSKGDTMNRIHKFTTAFMLGLAATAMAQTNLLSNPGFESGASGWMLWTQTASPAIGTVTYPTTGGHAGAYARVAVTTPAASAADNWHIQFQPP